MGINGYTGAILWRRPLHEGFNIHRNTMIATSDTLFLGDDESCKLIDAATGNVKDQIVVPDGWAMASVEVMSLENGADGRPVLYTMVGGAEIQPKTVLSKVGGWGDGTGPCGRDTTIRTARPTSPSAGRSWPSTRRARRCSGGTTKSNTSMAAACA